ncbi:phosphatase PAP2 family protein [Nonomuraea glycinis]|uniref:phosphatase PAP2 family protein n=1 Tax=Nonomuraea glycinis TaxID=2047744 RepID=UPI0033A9B6A2
MGLQSWKAFRSYGDGGLGARLTVASVTVALVMIPFMLLLVLAKLPLNPLDARVARDLHQYALAHPGVTRLLIVWTDVFGPFTWRLVVVAAAVWLWVRGARRVAVWAATTIIVGGLLGFVLKIIVSRARPSLPDPVALAPGEAFPSGHALHVTLGAGVLVLLILPRLPAWGRLLTWALAWLLVVSVAYTRVALAVHWVSDVVAGVMLGVAVLAGTVAAFETWRREQGRKPLKPAIEGIEPEAVRTTRDRD